jgi:hypothetical protein
MFKMIRAPEMTQAGEIAAIVKRELNPQMAAITTGLVRLASAVEITLGASTGSAMGDAATHSTPTFELLRELQYSMRLQAERICTGTEFLHKVGLAVLETLLSANAELKMSRSQHSAFISNG